MIKANPNQTSFNAVCGVYPRSDKQPCYLNRLFLKRRRVRFRGSEMIRPSDLRGGLLYDAPTPFTG
jgi:hypothetical protein